ncbi:MAG: hypothetical protein KXJ50_08165 [Vulcanococcus sp.]|jgi:predicted nucleic acid-binding protein|uniref:hypothetical protein n=1 Tax=Vulcanococcus sp. TaxID=2856995 RepID=UPI0025E0A1FC|nr:hypothetical protein [Vulcanococcus sp.]MBW0174376.1 hypothetical protein [Vulcanococcus sp.]MBW0181024.1 hypothetical protein [Vulcanococcus sp.]
MRALLDINVVIALLDAEHVMHTQATQWLARELDNGWASWPVPQNGVLRIFSQPAYSNHRPDQLVVFGAPPRQRTLA